MNPTEAVRVAVMLPICQRLSCAICSAIARCEATACRDDRLLCKRTAVVLRACDAAVLQSLMRDRHVRRVNRLLKGRFVVPKAQCGSEAATRRNFTPSQGGKPSIPRVSAGGSDGFMTTGRGPARSQV